MSYKNHPVVSLILTLLYEAVFILSCVGLFFMLVCQNYKVPTPSMCKTIPVNAVLFVEKISHGARTPAAFRVPLTDKTFWGTDIRSFLYRPKLPMFRLPALAPVKRGEVLVFNAPHEVNYPVSVKTLYVKRFIGLPGDRLQMEDEGAKAMINGTLEPNTEKYQYCYWLRTTHLLESRLLEKCGIGNQDYKLHPRSGCWVYQIYTTPDAIEKLMKADNQLELLKTPYEFVFVMPEPGIPLRAEAAQKENEKGNLEVTINAHNCAFYANLIQKYENPGKVEVRDHKLYVNGELKEKYKLTNEYVPFLMPKKGFIIPYKGMKIVMTQENLQVYGYLIICYEGHTDVQFRNGKLYINGTPVKEYTFKQNYYWAMGDNRNESLDSRFWGLVPEDHIVGKPLFIWVCTKNKNNYMLWDLLTLQIDWKYCFKRIK